MSPWNSEVSLLPHLYYSVLGACGVLCFHFVFYLHKHELLTSRFTHALSCNPTWVNKSYRKLMAFSFVLSLHFPFPCHYLDCQHKHMTLEAFDTGKLGLGLHAARKPYGCRSGLSQSSNNRPRCEQGLQLVPVPDQAISTCWGKDMSWRCIAG